MHPLLRVCTHTHGRSTPWSTGINRSNQLAHRATWYLVKPCSTATISAAMSKNQSSQHAMQRYQKLKKEGKLNYSLRSAIVDHAHVLETPSAPFSQPVEALKSAKPLEFVKDVFQQPSFRKAKNPFGWELYAKYSDGNGVAFALRKKEDREITASIRVAEAAKYTLYVCTTAAVSALFGKQSAAPRKRLLQLKGSDYKMQPFSAWNGTAWVQLDGAKAACGYFWYKTLVNISADDVGKHVLVKLAAQEEFEAWCYI